MRALLAEVGPETDGSNASDEDNQQPEGNADDYMSGIDDQKSPDAAKNAKEERVLNSVSSQSQTLLVKIWNY
jgi:hypothetical protein